MNTKAKHKSEILKLFYGELDCDEIQKSNEYKRISSEKSKCYYALKEKLSATPELAALLDKYVDYENRICVEDSDDFYSYGFKHGLLLGLEINPKE